MLPNFLIVGAEKAGTTTLAHTLAQHPEVFMCSPKEPRFFSNQNWQRGLAWYERLFDQSGDAKAIGEASTAYTWAPESPEVPQRIQQTLGDIRYLYIVRNPVDRLISHYRHAQFHRWVPDGASVEEAMQRIPGLVECGRYAFQLERFEATTTRKQWKVVVLEELIEQPTAVMADIFEFLNVTPHSIAQLAKENAMAEQIRPPRLLRPLRRMQQHAPPPIATVCQWLIAKTGRSIPKPQLSTDQRKRLWTRFEADCAKLSDYCSSDLKRFWPR